MLRLRAVLERMISQPPSWTTIQYLHVGIVIWCGIMIMISEARWIWLFNAFIAGISVASIYFIQMIKWYQENWNRMNQQHCELMDLNRAMLEDRISLHIASIEIGENDDDAPKPTLN